MANCNSTNMPILENTKLTMNSLEETLNDDRILRYQLIIKSLTFVMQGTQPDLAFVVSLCSRFLAKPTAIHIGLAKQVLRYLKGSTNLGITYHYRNIENLFVHIDANYQDKTLSGDGKSTLGYRMYLARGLVSWSSRRQHYVTTSSTKSKYIGQANVVK